MENKMFCFQCQETAGCKACTQVGVCGKKPEVAGLQDLLIYVTKGLSAVTTALREGGKTVSEAVNDRVTLNLFITTIWWSTRCFRRSRMRISTRRRLLMPSRRRCA